MSTGRYRVSICVDMYINADDQNIERIAHHYDSLCSNALVVGLPAGSTLSTRKQFVPSEASNFLQVPRFVDEEEQV